MNSGTHALAWPDLVFHVLAHVRGTEHLAASLFDERYVAFAEGELGPISERQLGTDCRLLDQVLASHEQLARVQTLAWLFSSIEQAQACEQKELVELAAEDVANPAVLTLLVTSELAATELLRCAAALECSAHARLPACSESSAELQSKLLELAQVAPVRKFKVRCVRALCRRGRVWGDEIWVGVPGEELGVSVEHAAWQAAHEATVSDVASLAAASDIELAERDVELVALVVLATRARQQSLHEEHAAWLRSLTLPETLRGAGTLEVSVLPAHLRAHAMLVCESQV